MWACYAARCGVCRSLTEFCRAPRYHTLSGVVLPRPAVEYALDAFEEVSVMSKTKYERTPLNAEGDFYVEKDMCITCLAPEQEAP